MKRATPTPNRFITFTPNWWVKGFVLFVALVFLGGCLDETALIGVKKEPRFDLKFKEFSIPVYTVQAGSIRSSSASAGDRLLCGKVVSPIDPKFGAITSKIFVQYHPYNLQINTEGKTNFVVTRVTFNLALDYYVYGDTLSSASTFTLHEITDEGIDPSKEYHTTDEISYNLTEISTATYDFKTAHFRADSLAKYATYNSDAISTNNVYDTLSFDIPSDSELADTLLKTATSKGIYSYKEYYKKDTINYYKTDSAFLKTFKGFAIIPKDGNRILGFKTSLSSLAYSSRIKLYYSYMEDGELKNDFFYYSLSNIASSDASDGILNVTSFSNITVDRSNTNLAGLPTTATYTNYEAPDNYCYLQSGTGLYAKLDFSAICDTFDLIENVAINSAELVVNMETPASRPHLRPPGSLFLRIVDTDNKFFIPPLISSTNSNGDPIMISNPIYAASYYCAANDSYLDAVDDSHQGLFSLQYKTDTNGQYYKGFLTEFFEYHTRLPNTVSRINYLALVPTNLTFGKSLDGVSFKNDQVKLRVYYTQTD